MKCKPSSYIRTFWPFISYCQSEMSSLGYWCLLGVCLMQAWCLLCACICLTQESLWSGLFDHQKKTEIQNSNGKAGGNGPQYIDWPFISQNSSYPKSRLPCTPKKRIRATQQSEKKSEFSGLRNLPKVPKMGYIAQRYKFWWFSDNISVGWPRIFFWIAALRPWFKCASFEYKEAYFPDNFNFDLQGA